MIIDKSTAAELLDFDTRIDNKARARDQLHGAVALHNILERHQVAYLADEVGMGKTYVALGVVALLRHFNPGARVLVIAPRQNIQRKWQKELQLFVKHNVRISDLRVRTPTGAPVRPLVQCDRLTDLVRETTLDPDRDFFMRLSSFSLAFGDDAGGFRDRLRRELPWIPSDLFDMRSGRQVVKDNLAQILNAAVPKFDLVIIDESHNLKHGYGRTVAARNRALAITLGRRGFSYDRRLPGTGPRAGRVLLLSATPIDDDYAQLWRQLDVVDRGDRFPILKDPDADEEAMRAAVNEFLIRRVTTLEVADMPLTKNLYRREWRHGGVLVHDEPLPLGSARERLSVALVQKKVSELLEDEAFGASFQIGMLASFESFLETVGNARLDVEENDDGGNFDAPDQAEDQRERDGIDVGELNLLARSYRQTFAGRELPHPKMDALVDRLSHAWRDGEKALVFVRRVRSVDELKARLDAACDEWLLGRLKESLVRRKWQTVQNARNEHVRLKLRRSRRDADSPDAGDDAGGLDTFFAYFFRGEGPPGVVSGARVNRRLQQRTGALATFFSENHVMRLLDAEPGTVIAALATALGRDDSELRDELRDRSRCFLSKTARVVARADGFAAMQAAPLELLAESRDARASAIHEELFRDGHGAPATTTAPLEQLETGTFFTQLRNRPELADCLLPTSSGDDERDAVRERHLRGLLLSATARLGHAFIDLWLAIASQLPTLEGEAELGDVTPVIAAYLDRLEYQMRTPLADRDWAAFDELSAVASHHDLILDVNLTTAERAQHPPELAQTVTGLLRSQRPVAGMSGQVNQSLVRQFRLPGYPLLMITTDLLQEGEDLHTFCSNVHHYGLAWTPSALEQRTGRIDRVRSATERRLTALTRPVQVDEKLQVHYPHLADTIERVQARRVLARMDEFVRLMHTDLAVAEASDSRIDIGRELLDASIDLPQPRSTPLKSAFEVRNGDLRGPKRGIEVDRRLARAQLNRFARLAKTALPAAGAAFDGQPARDLMLGTARLPDERVQPFSLQLAWWETHLVVRCISPIGMIDDPDALGLSCARRTYLKARGSGRIPYVPPNPGNSSPGRDCRFRPRPRSPPRPGLKADEVTASTREGAWGAGRRRGDRAAACWRLGSRRSEASCRRDHGYGSFVDGVDDLGVVDPAQVRRSMHGTGPRSCELASPTNARCPRRPRGALLPVLPPIHREHARLGWQRKLGQPPPDRQRSPGPRRDPRRRQVDRLLRRV